MSFWLSMILFVCLIAPSTYTLISSSLRDCFMFSVCYVFMLISMNLFWRILGQKLFETRRTKYIITNIYRRDKWHPYGRSRGESIGSNFFFYNVLFGCTMFCLDVQCFIGRENLLLMLVGWVSGPFTHQQNPARCYFTLVFYQRVLPRSS